MFLIIAIENYQQSDTLSVAQDYQDESGKPWFGRQISMICLKRMRFSFSTPTIVLDITQDYKMSRDTGEGEFKDLNGDSVYEFITTDAINAGWVPGDRRIADLQGEVGDAITIFVRCSL